MASPVIFWFRRDLRLADNPALSAAAALGRPVVPLFVVDDQLLAPSGPTRAAYLEATLGALSSSLDDSLVVRRGSPAAVIRDLAREVGADSVFATGDSANYGRRRDHRVAEALSEAGITAHFVSTPYIVPPGTIRSKTGDPFKVFTAFRRVWDTLEVEAPLPAPSVAWITVDGEPLNVISQNAGKVRPAFFSNRLPDAPPPLPAVGESAAWQLVHSFHGRIDRYDETRNDPGLNGTSALSPHLRWGTIHPRQLVAEFAGPGDGRRVWISEVTWREFYADVLFHQPQSVWENLQPQMNYLQIDRDASALQRFEAWALGETGYPLVDAGMRQLLATGWMHNRVRMVAASFLVKHLHLDWRWGARWFMWRLFDGDLASNQHGWQWTAGTGTDAAPYHRIFNPTTQAERFDPRGEYVTTFIPELRGTAAPQCLQPGGGEGLLAPTGYVAPIVEAKAEREEALRRFAEAREMAKAARG